MSPTWTSHCLKVVATKKSQHNKHIHLTSLLHHQRNIWQTVKECTTLSYTSEPECSVFIKVQFYLLRHKTFLVFLWLCGVLYLSGFFFSEIMSIYCIWLHFYSSAIYSTIQLTVHFILFIVLYVSFRICKHSRHSNSNCKNTHDDNSLLHLKGCTSII